MGPLSPTTRYLTIAAGIIAFALLMALRDQTSSFALRTIIAAAAGACMGVALLFAGRR